jgi:DNA repair protein SbcD/Mre11
MRLLHTADIHLGIDTHGRMDPATGLSTRLQDFQRSFDFMVERALKDNVDTFLFAGDAYRNADPTPTHQRLFVECLRPLLEARIPVAMIVGNHDHPVSFGKASALDIFGFLEGDVQVFNRPGLHRIETKSGPLQLIALPWPIRSGLLAREELRSKTPSEIRDLIEQRYGALAEGFAAECDPALPTVLMGHFSVLGAELGGSERSSLIAHEPKLLASALAVPPVDYVALGHIHRHQDLNPGGVPVVYASSIERVSFKEMDDNKGFVRVDIDAGKPAGQRATYTFVPTPARRFVSVVADARKQADPTESILDAIAKADISDAVVRVRYVVDEDGAGRVDVKRLREALSAAYVVAAVERTVEAAERQRRTVVTRELSLRDALERYIAQRDELAPIKERLIEAGLGLEGEA